jgi:hypothetical protein
VPEPSKSFRRYVVFILSMDLLQWAYLFVKLMILPGPQPWDLVAASVTIADLRVIPSFRGSAGRTRRASRNRTPPKIWAAHPTNACCNTVARLVEGKSVENAWGITPENVIDYLETLTPENYHCAELAVGAFVSGPIQLSGKPKRFLEETL